MSTGCRRLGLFSQQFARWAANMLMRHVVIVGCTLAIAGCEQIKDLTGEKSKPASETTSPAPAADSNVQTVKSIDGSFEGEIIGGNPKPGSKFSYSNLGIIFLGRVIESLSGDDYEVYVDKNIFKPLEMHRSYFDATPYHLLKNRSASYFAKEGKVTPARFDADTGITVSNGGLNSPMPDMVKYITFLTGDVRRQAIYDQVLKRSSLEEMFQPQISIASSEMVEPQGQNRKDSMGLSFFIEDNYGQHFIGHSGSQNGFIAHFYLRPDTRTAYIIAFNTHATATEKDSSQDTRRLDREIKDYLFQNVFPLFAVKK